MIAPATPSVAAMIDRREDARQHVHEDDADIAAAEGARRLDVLELAHDEHLAANESRHARPADDADRDEDDT